MGLREYQRKRNFGRTPEPAAASPAATDGRAGAKAKPAAPQSLAQATTPAGAFVVQKHDASRLHYDFRLELDGVLKSWAVPKGPCLDPTEKRLAVQTEDHPLEYTEFEGVIPEGSYGGGTMMVWDLGRWSPLGDAHRDYLAGKLKFRLEGQKLRGAWMLVRMPGNGAKGKANWLLFKERDSEARPLAEGDILAEMPFSASTGRSLDEIAAGKPAR